MDNDETYKKYTIQAKRWIKGEAFFEALRSDYSLPHQIVSSKDVGIDYICEWVDEDRPTGILYAVQVKTFSEETAKPHFIEVDRQLNGLRKFRIANPNLTIDDKTLHDWKGLGMPVYLFAVVQITAGTDAGEVLDCYYKRFTPVLTAGAKQEDADFYKVNNRNAFIAFAQPERRLGFARDLFIDYIRWCYYKGSITYLNPRTIGLNQFEEEDSVDEGVPGTIWRRWKGWSGLTPYCSGTETCWRGSERGRGCPGGTRSRVSAGSRPSGGGAAESTAAPSAASTPRQRPRTAIGATPRGSLNSAPVRPREHRRARILACDPE